MIGQENWALITSFAMGGNLASALVVTVELGSQDLRQLFGLHKVKHVRVEGRVFVRHEDIVGQLRACFGNEELRVTFEE